MDTIAFSLPRTRARNPHSLVTHLCIPQPVDAWDELRARFLSPQKYFCRGQLQRNPQVVVTSDLARRTDERRKCPIVAQSHAKRRKSYGLKILPVSD